MHTVVSTIQSIATSDNDRNITNGLLQMTSIAKTPLSPDEQIIRQRGRKVQVSDDVWLSVIHARTSLLSGSGPAATRVLPGHASHSQESSQVAVERA